MSEQDKITLTSKKDFRIEWFSGGGGGGGQYKNKHDNCCRLVHLPSGAMTQSTRHRNQVANRKDAWEAMLKHPTFKMWLSARLLEVRTGETVESRVEALMRPHNLLIEGINADGQWEELQ